MRMRPRPQALPSVPIASENFEVHGEHYPS